MFTGFIIELLNYYKENKQLLLFMIIVKYIIQNYQKVF